MNLSGLPAASLLGVSVALAGRPVPAIDAAAPAATQTATFATG